MFHNSPKLIIKIDLDGNTGLSASLILLDKHFKDNTETTCFFANNGFMIYKGRQLTLYKSGSMTLPKDFSVGDNRSVKLNFDSDKDRYKFLKSLKNALIEWSKSKIWEGFNEPSRIKLNFSTKVWVLF